MPSSKLKVAIANVRRKKVLLKILKLKATPSLNWTYSEVFPGQSCCRKHSACQPPGLRIYKRKDELPKVMAGLVSQLFLPLKVL